MNRIVGALQTILLVFYLLLVLISMAVIEPIRHIVSKFIERYKEKLTYAELYTVATVIKLEYRPLYHKNSFVFGTMFYGGEHYIYLSYEGREYVIDDEEVFQKVSVGSEVDVYGHIGVNEKSGRKYIHINGIVNTE